MTTKISMFVLLVHCFSLMILFCRAYLPGDDDPTIKKLHFLNRNNEEDIGHAVILTKTTKDEASPIALNRVDSSLNHGMNILTRNDEFNAKKGVIGIDSGNVASDEDRRRFEGFVHGGYPVYVGNDRFKREIPRQHFEGFVHGGYPVYVGNDRFKRGIRRQQQMKRDVLQDAGKAEVQRNRWFHGRTSRRGLYFTRAPVYGTAMTNNNILYRKRRYATYINPYHAKRFFSKYTT